MTLISKTAGVLSLVSCITDMHKTALIVSNNEYAKASSDTFIANSIGTQKADRLSYKDTERKNWLAKNSFMNTPAEIFARVKGYLSGLVQSGVRYVPNFILSAVALLTSKDHKAIANISAIGLACLEAYDFIKNSTNIFQRNDYLE